MNNELPQMIKKLASNAGYSSCGITSVEPFQEFDKALRDRISQFPEAANLYFPLIEKMDFRSSAPWARSIVVCTRRYGKYKIPKKLDLYFGRYYLFDRRIPECPDFNIAKQFEVSINNLGIQTRRGGIPYRWAGARAGITHFGKNCFSYSEHGSWIDFDAWLINVELPPDQPTLNSKCPKNCRICIDACPTNALIEPYVMRRDRCIAHLTYEASEPIASDIWNKMGSWVYGCDVCQQVCPLNKSKWESIEIADWLEKISDFLLPKALAKMDIDTYLTKVHPYFWYIPVDNLARWHANATRAVQNSSEEVK